MAALEAGRGGRIAAALFVLMALALSAWARWDQLEADVPAWETANYQPLDEAYYSFDAVQRHFRSERTERLLADIPHHLDTMRALQNGASGLGFAMFGNTLQGLRLPALAWSLAALALLLAGAREAAAQRMPAAPAARTSMWLLGAALAVVYALEPGVLLLGVANEPTGVRVFGAAFALWFVLRLRAREPARCELLAAGAVAGVNVFWVYPSNAFVALFVVLAVPCAERQPKAWLRAMVVSRAWMGLGFALAVLPIAAWKLWLLQLGAVTVSLGVFKDRVVFDNAFYNVAVFDVASSFAANPALLAVAVAVLIWSVAVAAAANRDRGALATVTVLVAAFLLQSMFINDYPTRKFNVIVPFLLLQTFLLSMAWVVPDDAAPPRHARRVLGLLGAAMLATLALARPYDSAFLEHVRGHAAWVLAAGGVLAVAAFAARAARGRTIAAVMVAALGAAAACTSFANFAALRGQRSEHYLEAMRELARQLPAQAYVTGWGGYSLAFAGGPQEPVGNMYLWTLHPRGEEFMRATLLALARSGVPVYWVGASPGVLGDRSGGVEWETMGRLQPDPLAATFRSDPQPPMDIHRLRH